MKFSLLAAAALTVIPASAETFLKEEFNDEAWESRWTVPTKWRNKKEMGGWVQTSGKYYADATDKGVQTGTDAKFYGMSAKMDKPYNSSDGKDLIIQYTVKHEQKIDCGGAYIKLLPGGDDFDSESFGGDTDYGVMFGPDICGATKRTHVILHSEMKDENLLINKDIPCESDSISHLYTLIIKTDNTFEVRVDNKSVRSGKLEDEFNFLEPKEIEDVTQTKPVDWVDEAQIPHPDSTKPNGYDDIMPEIADPSARQPDDWDEEDDGEWEAPMVDNPDYRGPWSATMIPNPDYKGPWVQPLIPNPDYKYDEDMHAVCADGCTHVGFELWQVKSGTIFDDILITDSLEEAQKFAEETFFIRKEGEAKMLDKENNPDNDDEDDLDEDDFEDGFADEF